jgi:hypothetical protein
MALRPCPRYEPSQITCNCRNYGVGKLNHNPVLELFLPRPHRYGEWAWARMFITPLQTNVPSHCCDLHGTCKVCLILEGIWIEINLDTTACKQKKLGFGSNVALPLRTCSFAANEEWQYMTQKWVDKCWLQSARADCCLEPCRGTAEFVGAFSLFWKENSDVIGEFYLYLENVTPIPMRLFLGQSVGSSPTCFQNNNNKSMKKMFLRFFPSFSLHHTNYIMSPIVLGIN